MHPLYHELRWLALLALLVASRLIPHPPSFTACMAVIVLLQYHYPRAPAMAMSLLALLVSDCLLTLGWGISLGNWMLFTYSGWLLCALVASISRNYLPALPLTLLCSALYWLWTNFGVWLIGEFYPHTLSGLLNCYLLAEPFLWQSLLGDVLWVSILSLSFGYQHLWQRQAEC